MDVGARRLLASTAAGGASPGDSREPEVQARTCDEDDETEQQDLLSCVRFPLVVTTLHEAEHEWQPEEYGPYYDDAYSDAQPYVHVRILAERGALWQQQWRRFKFR